MMKPGFLRDMSVQQAGSLVDGILPEIQPVCRVQFFILKKIDTKELTNFSDGESKTGK